MWFLHLQRQVPSWNVLPLKMMAPLTFEKVGTAHPTTQHYIPEDLHHQQNCCENLKCPENKLLYS
jgi:hypothetical protein